jgi:hypothetical protein
MQFALSFFSVIAGIVWARLHFQTYDCFGGSDPTAGCKGGATRDALSYLYYLIVADSLSNILFTLSKIMMLQRCFSISLSGTGKSFEGRKVRLLTAVVSLVGVSSALWLLVSLLHLFKGLEFLKDNGDLSDAENAEKERERYELRAWVYCLGAATVMIATLCAFLYLFLTVVHLKRHLNALRANSALVNINENLTGVVRTDVFAQHLSRKMLRMRMSVVIIVFSFIVKAVLYMIFAVGYSSPNPTKPQCYAQDDFQWEAASNSRYMCDTNVYSSSLIAARTLMASPLVIPLITLFSDPLTLMCVYALCNAPLNPKPQTSSNCFRH